MKELRGRTALLTGAAGGLAEYIGSALAAEGVNLVISDLPGTPLEERAEQLRERGVRVETLEANLAERSEAVEIVGRAEEALGPLDLLVNNAGIEFIGPFLDRTPAEIETLIDVDLTALMLTTHAVLPGMIERGDGHVVNIASMAGKASFPGLATYCGAKHGVVGFTHALRSEYGEAGVGFSAICPGIVARAGMFGRLEAHLGQPPGPVATVPPEKVGAAVVRSIRDDRAEIIVQPGGRALAGLASLAPKVVSRFSRNRRARGFSEKAGAVSEQLPDRPAEKIARPD